MSAELGVPMSGESPYTVGLSRNIMLQRVSLSNNTAGG